MENGNGNLVQNALQLGRNFGIPAAFYFAFHVHSSNMFPVRLLLSGTAPLKVSHIKQCSVSIFN